MSIVNHGNGLNSAGWSGIPSPEQASEFVARQQKQDPDRGVERALGSVAGPHSALHVQIGGDHYKSTVIQPVEYISANNLNFLEGCIVKRITRWRVKNGVEDLLKIKHEVDLLIEMEQRQGNLIGSKGAAIR